MDGYIRTLQRMFDYRDNDTMLKDIRDNAKFEAAKAVKVYDKIVASGKLEKETLKFFEYSLPGARSLANKYKMESNLNIKNTKDVIDFLKARTKLNNPDYKINRDGDIIFRETPRRAGYWMHTDFDPAVLNASMLKELEIIKNTKEMSNNDKAEKEKAIRSYFRGIRAQDIAPDMMANVQEANLLTQKEGISRLQAEAKQLELQTAIDRKPGVVHKRTMDLDGYSRKFGVLEKYIRTTNKAIYTKAGALLSRETINGFIKGNSMGKQTQNWATFQKMYARDVLGYPSLIPEHIYAEQKGRPLHDPLNLKYAPYRVMSDQNVLTEGTKLNKIFKKIYKIFPF